LKPPVIGVNTAPGFRFPILASTWHPGAQSPGPEDLVLSSLQLPTRWVPLSRPCWEGKFELNHELEKKARHSFALCRIFKIGRLDSGQAPLNSVSPAVFLLETDFSPPIAFCRAQNCPIASIPSPHTLKLRHLALAWPTGLFFVGI
jgi:hypothetical protein